MATSRSERKTSATRRLAASDPHSPGRNDKAAGRASGWWAFGDALSGAGRQFSVTRSEMGVNERVTLICASGAPQRATDGRMESPVLRTSVRAHAASSAGSSADARGCVTKGRCELSISRSRQPAAVRASAAWRSKPEWGHLVRTNVRGIFPASGLVQRTASLKWAKGVGRSRGRTHCTSPASVICQSSGRILSHGGGANRGSSQPCPSFCTRASNAGRRSGGTRSRQRLVLEVAGAFDAEVGRVDLQHVAPGARARSLP